MENSLNLNKTRCLSQDFLWAGGVFDCDLFLSFCF